MSTSRGGVMTKVLLGVVVLLVVVALIGRSGSSKSPAPVVTSNQPPTLAAGSQAPKAVPPTDQQRLETAVRGQLGGTGLQVSFKDATIEKDDPGRPSGSKFVTVDLNLGDFLDKDQLTRDSGTIVSNIVQQVYAINPHFYDVIVMFYGPTKDAYGNSNTSLILSYGTDKPEVQRINWAGFNKASLCALLSRDANAQDDVYLGCHYLVNVQ